MPKSSREERIHLRAERRGRGETRVEPPRCTRASNRVNIAFPFSQIKVEEPSKELAELAALVFDLVGAMAEWVPEDRLDDLRARAQVLRESLR